MQPAREPGQVLPWSLALAVRRVAVERRRRRTPALWASPGPGVEGRDRETAETLPGASTRMGVSSVRITPCSMADSVGERLAFDRHRLPRQEAGEPVQRQAIQVLRHE